MSDKWRTVRFQDCCDLVKSKSDPLALSADTAYVGLEHITPSVGRLTGVGFSTDVSSLVSVFQADDVLFGRLRPYLKKVAIAHFGGVCSPEVLVLRTRQDVILPGFLFLVASSDAVIDHAVALSAGSRMPRTSFVDLGSYELLLPPLLVQRRIVDLMTHLDNHIANLKVERESIRVLRAAAMSVFLSGSYEIPNSYETAIELADSRSGAEHVDFLSVATSVSGGWPKVKLQDLVDILDSKRKPISSDERQKRTGSIPYFGANGQAGWIDDFIFNERLILLGEDAIDFGNPAARKAYLVDGPSWVNNHAHVLRAHESIVLSEFLCHSLNFTDYSNFAAFGTRSKLTQANMRMIEIEIPPLPVQRRIVDFMSHVDNQAAAIDLETSELGAIRLQVLASLLSRDVELDFKYDALVPEVV